MLSSAHLPIGQAGPSTGVPLALGRCERWWLWVAVLAGSLVRGAYGVYHSLWDTAPDQLAWGMGFDDLVANGLLGYRQLIHYPHEGGTLVLSLLAIPFKALDGVMPPLSWAALLVDSFSRAVQILVACRLFGRTTGRWFAVWTVLGVPLVLPWATINCGLHSLVSFAPFLLVYLARRPDVPVFRLGLITGVLACLSYDVLTFVPAVIGWWCVDQEALRERLKRVALFLLACGLGLLPHIASRTLFDNGFGLERMSPLSVRGLEHAGVDWSGLLDRLWIVLHEQLPASFLLKAPLEGWPRVAAIFFLLVFIGAVVRWCLDRRVRDRSTGLMLVVILVFCAAIAVGPFFEHRPDGHGTLYFRYFPYIIPLLCLFVLHCWGQAAWWSNIARGLFVAVCMYASLEHLRDTPIASPPNDRAVGWVLSRKYGHEPDVLLRMLHAAPDHKREDLAYGYGWGTAAALFDRKVVPDTVDVLLLDSLMMRYDAPWRPMIADGVLQAFGDGITPVLDQRIGEMLRERYARSAR